MRIWFDFPQDVLLTEGVALYKESGGWARVAEHVGGGVTVNQCRIRWSHYLGRMQQEGIKQGDWSDEEVGSAHGSFLMIYRNEILCVMSHHYRCSDWRS